MLMGNGSDSRCALAGTLATLWLVDRRMPLPAGCMQKDIASDPCLFLSRENGDFLSEHLLNHFDLLPGQYGPVIDPRFRRVTLGPFEELPGEWHAKQAKDSRQFSVQILISQNMIDNNPVLRVSVVSIVQAITPAPEIVVNRHCSVAAHPKHVVMRQSLVDRVTVDAKLCIGIPYFC